MDAKTQATATANDVTDTNSTTAITTPKPIDTSTSNLQNESGATEQRSTGNTENKAESSASGNENASGSGSGSAKQGVSEEALKGPQGPPPHPASEFEAEAKGKRPPVKETKPGKHSFSLGTAVYLVVLELTLLPSRVRISG